MRRVVGCWVVTGLALLAGCGTRPSPSPGAAPAGTASAPVGTRPIVFVGFDTSAPVVAALRAGRVRGLVVQDPVLMGELGVKTLAAHLGKAKVEAFVDTGSAMITPENLTEPTMAALLSPAQERNTSGAGLSAGRSKAWKVFVVPKGTSHEFWKSIHAGARRAADELGTVELIWQGPAKEGDRLQQIQLVQNAIAAKVDGIVLAPVDSKALARPVEEAVAKGIPVVVIDSPLESKAITSLVATDNYQGGVLAARRLSEQLEGKGRIILLRYDIGSSSTEMREKGFTETIAKEFPGITYLSDSEYAGPTAESAQRKAQTLVTRFRGQVDGIFCPNETSTEGMLRALDAAGMLPPSP